MSRNLPDALRRLFAELPNFSLLGTAICDALDPNYDASAPGKYNDALRELLDRMKAAARLVDQRAPKERA